MITGKNESKILTKDISCEFISKFDGKKCTSDQGVKAINVEVSLKNIIYVKKITFGILLNLASIMDDLVITCD